MSEIVGVRTGGVVDDRVGAVLLELGVGPHRPLPARVLGHVELVRAHSERRGRCRGCEVHLRHLPVALVLVGEIVERVVESVSDRELARMQRIAGHVRVDRRRPTVIPASKLPLVPTARIERIARRVEVEGRS